MNDFARRHDGDIFFKRVMIGASLIGAMFAIYLLTY
jgi:hypothetical protein